MDVLRWDPFSDLTALQDRINRAFEESMSRGPARREPATTRTWAPLVDILENESQLVVKADLPGMKQEEISVEFTGDVLSIRGTRSLDADTQKEKPLRIERPYGEFLRSFTIGVPVNQDAIKASYKEGVLEVILPKAEETKPRKVEIRTE